MRPRRLGLAMLTLPALLIGSLATAAPVLAACETSTDQLMNGGFETPAVPPATVNFFTTETAPWQTTDSLGEIEIWGTGFNGVPAAEGNAFAELNANSDGTLYQDVISTPGATMSWTLLHRAREGNDTMQVLIGDANVADVNGTTGWDFISADLTDGTADWGAHSGDYVVPAGQTCTRFAFRTVSTGSGIASIGNFLDQVAFTVTLPPDPDPDPTDRPTPPPTDAIASTGRGGTDGPLAWIGIVAVAASVAVGAALARTRQPDRRQK